MASPRVGSPMMSCQRSTGIWLVTMVEARQHGDTIVMWVVLCGARSGRTYAIAGRRAFRHCQAINWRSERIEWNASSTIARSSIYAKVGREFDAPPVLHLRCYWVAGHLRVVLIAGTRPW